MSTTIAVDRSRLCTFTFDNGSKCRIPLSPSHPYLCTFHARKVAEDRAADDAVRDIAFHLSGRYVSFCDLSAAIATTITAVAYSHIPARTAATIAYLTQNLVQSLAGAEREYKSAFGVQNWRETVAHNFNSPRPAAAPATTTAAPTDATPHQTSCQPEQDHTEDDPEPDLSDLQLKGEPTPSDLADSSELPSQPDIDAALDKLHIAMETR
jgi:hypothetical protein